MTITPSHRSGGVLLHPSSLPSPYGIGDLGPAAYHWVDLLAAAEQSWWQTLPLGPTGFGDSPYQSLSSFAGNPYLISPDLLIQDGLLKKDDVAGIWFPAGVVDYATVIPFKVKLLELAWQNFRRTASAALKAEYEDFGHEQSSWLEDYTLFMVLKDSFKGRSWHDWPADLVERNQAALAVVCRNLAEPISQHRFRQFLFYRQWFALKAHANSQGLRLIGDVPIFVASDSSDLWANPELFLLDEQRKPTVVAGVPPDYFSPTGQHGAIRCTTGRFTRRRVTPGGSCA